ncbi:MAG TPA: ABC transporter permease [Anaerolineaceae bacterium]|jgi:multidrug/hemolysin transport system permease protein|nr:ABC transporter permease [Anaerolineaceae bacterium]
MKATTRIANRVFKLFFRDKSAIFFTLLASIILLTIHLVFLNRASFSDEQMKMMPDLVHFQNTWLTAGLAVITAFSASFTGLAQMPVDRKTRAFDDFQVAPVRRSQIVAGYILGSTFTAFVMSLATIAFTYIFLVVRKSPLPGIQNTLLIVVAVLLTTLVSSGLAFLFASGRNSVRSYGSVSSLMLTLIGFFAGAYIPFGVLGKSVQTIMSWLPFSHMASLARKFYMADAIKSMSIPAQFDIANLRFIFGVDLEMLGKQVSPWLSAGFILLWALLFFGIGLFRIRKEQD